tara:strand:+ start:219 stop:761 length:543 start_codon:yes stop_codon:yes gene_type:complete
MEIYESRKYDDVNDYKELWKLLNSALSRIESLESKINTIQRNKFNPIEYLNDNYEPDINFNDVEISITDDDLDTFLSLGFIRGIATIMENLNLECIKTLSGSKIFYIYNDKWSRAPKKTIHTLISKIHQEIIKVFNTKTPPLNQEREIDKYVENTKIVFNQKKNYPKAFSAYHDKTKIFI